MFLLNWFTQVVPDKIHRAVKLLCVCVCVCLQTHDDVSSSKVESPRQPQPAVAGDDINQDINYYSSALLAAMSKGQSMFVVCHAFYVLLAGYLHFSDTTIHFDVFLSDIDDLLL